MTDDHYLDREQSQVKHRILERYLQAFAPIIGSAFDEIVYVDCFAGPWKNRDEELTDTSFHKALSVFRECKKQRRCKRVRALLIENDSASYRQLESYASKVKDIEVVTKQWDFTEHVPDIVSFAKESRKSFPFFFIDPTGWKEICIDCIRPILQVSPGEVLINLMSSWVKRFLDDPTKPFGDLLGKDVERLRLLQGEELDDELVESYAQQVREEGRFAYTCAIPILMPDRDAIHYHLIYGTRDFKGLEEFKKTEAVAIPYMRELLAKAQRRHEEQNSSQGFLLPPSETHREQRFRNLNERRLEAARLSILKLLKGKISVAYKDLFQESMQFATVTEKDLRIWLNEWQSAGMIEYANWAKNQRAPRPETVIKATKKL